MVQVLSTSELHEGPWSSVPGPSAKDIVIGSREHIVSADTGAALPDHH